ncbi:phosphodiester glycosidase family protein [Oligoflexia bacterium]|nr:phosphodiester glycosidase family protein [Oligoflexia bacterium]
MDNLSTRFICLGLLLLCPVLSQASELPSTIHWKKIGDDLQLAKVEYSPKPLFVTEIVLLRSSLTRFRVGAIRAAEYGRRTADVKLLCKASKAVACINANFFDENHQSLGLVVQQGITHQKLHRGGKTLTGVFLVTRDAIKIVNRANLPQGSLIEAVQAGPRLISDGQVLQELREKSSLSRRSGICLDRDKRVIFYAVSSGLLGISIEQLQALLVHKAIDCVDALNLDGGGSSQFFLSKDIPGGASATAKEIFIAGRDAVPVALGLFLRDQS